MQLVANQRGGYRFLTGIDPYSSGVVAEPGYEIVYATLRRPLPVREGFARVEAQLRGLGRPRQALCAMALRSPAAFSFEGFRTFNAGYQAILRDWDLLVEGSNPIARTNVAPVHNPPSEPVLHAFGYTVPAADTEGAPSFVVAGAGDFREQGKLSPELIVRRGETGPDAMAEKAAAVMRAMLARVSGLGVSVDDIAIVDVYTPHPIHAFLRETLLASLGDGAAHGVRWYLSHPPIEGLEFEMDLRGVRTELRL